MFLVTIFYHKILYCVHYCFSYTSNIGRVPFVSSISLVVVDSASYLKVANTLDALDLQEDIDSVFVESLTCGRWNANATKCKAMRASRKSHAPPSYFFKRPLTSVSLYNYLGVHIYANTSAQIHVDYVINNTNFTESYLKQTVYEIIVLCK